MYKIQIGDKVHTKDFELCGLVQAVKTFVLIEPYNVGEKQRYVDINEVVLLQKGEPYGLS